MCVHLHSRSEEPLACSLRNHVSLHLSTHAVLKGNGLAVGGKVRPSGRHRIRLRYHGRSVTVPVIDRGPYVAGRDYDLTEAVKEKLDFPGVGTVLSSR